MVLQTQIERECSTDTGRTELEELYVEIKVCITEQLTEDIHESTFAAVSGPTFLSSAKLPRLALPTFDGNYADYKNFSALFNQMVDQQNSLSNIEKFNQLISCLKGPALETVKRHMRICSVGESHTYIKFGTSATIKSRLEDFKMPIDFCVTSHIAYQPESDIDTSSGNIPKNTPLADEKFHKTRHIDLLIGTETFFEILAVGQIKLGPNLPMLQKTLLGWIVSGRYKGGQQQTHCYSLSQEESINNNLERLWRIEDLSKPIDKFIPEHDTVEGLQQLKAEVIEVLGKGKFELAKWHSNHPDFVDDSTFKDLNLEDGSVTSTLGLAWNQRLGVLLFAFRPKCSVDAITKRTILSVASSLFDPLGLVAPIIVTAKIILQELWIVKLQWDESVPQNLYLAWKSFAASLTSLESLKIPRFCMQPNTKELQLHGFCDASIRAYGCCIYACTVAADGEVQVHLITSKCKVAPTRKLSLPKLELAASHLLAQLYVKIKGIFTSKQTYLWSDSSIVLHWIQQHSSTLSTFVGNRVSDIQEATPDCHWRHVPTKLNPADLVSRGCTPIELNESIWFMGPAYLKLSSHTWPRDKHHEPDPEIVALEMRKSAFKATTDINYLLDTLRNISSHRRCLRIVAWMLRFIHALRKPVELSTPSPSPQEIQRAFNCIIWNLQQQHFADEINALNKNRQISSHKKFPNPFLQITDGYQLLKVGDRLELANAPEVQKHPIILPSKDDFVRHYVQFLHVQHYHAGSKALVALIRLQFWIINARDLARSIVRRPFAHCGVDFCGPVNVYLRIQGKAPRKAYIAIFVCFATKAVHIEVVSDLSTDAFLAALRRMIARRGLPVDIFCDNATNFTGASNQLKELRTYFFKQENQQAPHFGGLWEAAVKSAKGLMTRSLMNARCTFEELDAITAEVEAILNSRPLTPLSSDPSDLSALTPGHFLVGDSLRALPEHNIEDEQLKSLDRWRWITGIKQYFWRRWLTDYFNELNVRHKWTKPSPSISIGDMVLIHEDNVPSQKWIMGRITATIPGRDQRRAKLFALIALRRAGACEFRSTASATKYSSGTIPAMTSAASSEIVLIAQQALIALSL
ncbi:uncharacterized protein LOC122757385 [Drosophila mojavensis]|uniref:uncharacterized protein LOC122757385 n=1 Tax=Drosophila mojavensis TaxID=7230 RepID=UPI001CD0DC81|nr:uncharacterized protein LOC122757385 [Drosophila mojavensis]